MKEIHFGNQVGKAPALLLTEKSFADVATGKIPNFEKFCRNLVKAIDPAQDTFPALNFLDALGQYSLANPIEIQNLLNNPEGRHVLIDNGLLKVVLIRWKPFEESNLHGHASGGCIFKVLSGVVEESRYDANDRQKLLSKGLYYAGNTAYIDDRLGLHIVRNPTADPVISLHLYTQGK